MTVTPQQQGKRFKAIATRAAQAADGKKGEDIRLFHIRPISSVADYMLIVSVTSPNHMKAVEEEVRIVLKSGGDHIAHRDGRKSDVWRVLDYGGLLVHIMHPKAREFYALDKLFHDAKAVRWIPSKRKSIAKPKAKPKAKAKVKVKVKKKTVLKKKRTARK